MTERFNALTPASPEVWLRRFVDEARHDVAFVTAGGHALTWSRFRFVYPRYRPVAEEWQPPAHSLDALVFHFGMYEVSIPGAVMEGEFQDRSNYSDEFDRLAESWRRAHPTHVGPLPMEAEILLDRMAAVHSKVSSDPRTYRQRLFLEAVQRRFTTRDLLKLALVLVMNEGYGIGSSVTDGDAGPWAGRADRLGQHRTAWCLAVRATDGHWRHRERFVEPRGAAHPAYPIARSMDLKLLGTLALRSAHPYWAPNLAMWSADYDASMKPSEGLDLFNVEGLYRHATAEDTTLLVRIRDSWSSVGDDDR